MFAVGDRLQVLVPPFARCDNYSDPMPRWSVNVEGVRSVFDIGDGIVFDELPSSSVGIQTTHGMYALMRVETIRLYDAAYLNLMSHSLLPSIRLSLCSKQRLLGMQTKMDRQDLQGRKSACRLLP
jgi:hypothetical protein